MSFRGVIVSLGCVCLVSGQTQVDLRTQAKSVDFSDATSTKPYKSGTVLPGTCSVGEAFFKTNAPAGANVYLCTAVNSWSQEAGSSGMSVAVNGASQGAQPTLNFISANGIVQACTNNTPANRVDCMPALDTSYALSRVADEAGIDHWAATVPNGNTSYLVRAVPPLIAYTPGSWWYWQPDVANGANPSWNINSLGPLTLEAEMNGALVPLRAGQLQPNTIYEVTVLSNSAAKVALPDSNLVTYPNQAPTGTASNELVKLTGLANGVMTAAGDKSGVVGIAVAGAGTTGSAIVATHGLVSCVFDGATTANDYVQISSVVNGNCHDAGPNYPASGGQILGRVLSTNASGGTYLMHFFDAEVQSLRPSQVSITDLAPVAAHSGLILAINAATAIHLTRLFCAIQGSTNVIVNLDKRTEATIGNDSGNHLLAADLVAVSGGANTSTFANGAGQCGATTSCAIAAHAPVVLTITSVSGAPAALNCSVDYTVDQP